MAKSKTPKPSSSAPPPAAAAEDLAALQSDVLSFASSLGLAGSLPSNSSGFDDSDFRKPPKKPEPNPKDKSNAKDKSNLKVHANLKDKSNSKDKFNEKVHPNAKDKSSLKSDSNQKGTENSKFLLRNKPKPLEITPFEGHVSGAQKSAELPLMKPNSLSGNWYIDLDQLESKLLTKPTKPTIPITEMQNLVTKNKELGERLLKQYTSEYEESARKRKSGDLRLLETSARSGTTNDKVSAFACLVEDNPIANLRSLDALLSMVTSKVGKRYAFTGFDALKELFLSRLLPDRKLKSLFQRPLDVLTETKDGYSLLLFWYFEECLKQRYEKFVIALEDALKDMLPNLKDKAMKTVFVLLKSKSEQERRLLTALVNKLGDPESKAASGAAHHLSLILDAHPNMKAVVIDEVDSFLFRPHIGMRAKYYAVIFLNQIYHTKRGDGPKIAKRAIDVYFGLFKVLLSRSDENSTQKDGKFNKRNSQKGKPKWKKEKTKGQNENNESNIEMDSRLLSALLTGVNRAFPFVSSDEADDIIEVQTPVLFKLVHSDNFNVGVQALMLLFQISSKNQIASDRFYRALYTKLLSPAAVVSSKPELFIGLLTKAMKNDLNLKRVAAFSKRLLQVALQRPPQYACGCLFLLSQVLIAKPPLWAMMLQNESVDDETEHFEDIKEESEDEKEKKADIEINDEKEKKADMELNVEKNNKINNNEEKENKSSGAGPTLPAGYDPRHREPSYCNADRTAWWELSLLANHVHPSVATMAKTLLTGCPIVYNGNPLSDLSLPAFLDKFMEKKPKSNKVNEGKWHGGSHIAPNRKMDTNRKLIGEEILQLAEDEVPPEDLFFHQYYMHKSKKSKSKKKSKSTDQEGSDDETAGDLLLDGDDGPLNSDEEELEEAEIDEVLGNGPILEDQEEYDYDDLDKIGMGDDEELLGNGSDLETEAYNNKNDDIIDSDDDINEFSDDDDINEVDDDWFNDDGNNDGDKEFDNKKNNKVKSGGKKRKQSTPFASLDDYEHLMQDVEEEGENSKSKKSRGKVKNSNKEDGDKKKNKKRKKSSS
ncbi:hypothetical protein LUZ60_012831 [Juncus effusus]|nr:hypothetical protein LUZ60_012831 [Juncus effusus]